MKQHITTKQLNEISIKARIELSKRFNPTKTIENLEGGQIVTYVPLLSMGQLIEFLDKNKKWKMFLSINHYLNGWGITDGENQGEKVLYYDEKELCDALWEAVKEALEE